MSLAKIRVFISKSHDPWFNLSVEDIIFDKMPADTHILFLWRNEDTVVIGRGQNPWKECNMHKMQQDKVKLARRSSGGGAVFHDLGNTCFTFMASKINYNKTISTQIILNALAQLDITAEISGRNDLIINYDGNIKKISGSAYRETIEKGFHHGTLLLNSNLTRLADYLKPDPKKLQAKGITSVKSRVENLSVINPTITHEKICQEIITAFFTYYETSVAVEYIHHNDMKQLPGLAAQYIKQSGWEWNFGKTPLFSQSIDTRFSWGGVEVFFNIKQGIIVDIKVFSDALYLDFINDYFNALLNKSFSPKSIKNTHQLLSNKYPLFHSELTELTHWLISSVC